MLHSKETELPPDTALRKGAAPPQGYLFKDEVFPCWYRSAPPKEKNQQVRKATGLCLLGERLDYGVDLSFAPFRERTKYHNYHLSFSYKRLRRARRHSARELSPGRGLQGYFLSPRLLSSVPTGRLVRW